MAIEILIADTDPQVLGVLRLLVELDPDIRVVATVDNATTAIAECRTLRPAVMLSDYDLICGAGETPASLQTQIGDTALLLLALYPLEAVTSARNDAMILPKDIRLDRLTTAIRAVAAGGQVPRW